MFTHQNQGLAGSFKPSVTNQVHPEARLGKPQRLHDAITQVQWMQLTWIAERARKTDCSFDLVVEQSGTLLTWTAKLTS